MVGTMSEVLRFPTARVIDDAADDPIERTARVLATDAALRRHAAFNYWCAHVRGTYTLDDVAAWDALPEVERADWEARAMAAIEAHWNAQRAPAPPPGPRLVR